MATLFYDAFSGSGSLLGRQADIGGAWKNMYQLDVAPAGAIAGGTLRCTQAPGFVNGAAQDTFGSEGGFTLEAGVTLSPLPAPPDQEQQIATVALTVESADDDPVRVSFGMRPAAPWYVSMTYVSGLSVSWAVPAMGFGPHIISVTLDRDGRAVVRAGSHYSTLSGVGSGGFVEARPLVNLYTGEYDSEPVLDYLLFTADGGGVAPTPPAWWRNTKNVTVE